MTCRSNAYHACIHGSCLCLLAIPPVFPSDSQSDAMNEYKHFLVRRSMHTCVVSIPESMRKLIQHGFKQFTIWQRANTCQLGRYPVDSQR